MSTDLNERIQKAKKATHKKVPAKQQESMSAGMELGFQVGLEIIVAPGVGGLLGYFIDRSLETNPWGLVIGLILGFIAAIFGIQRLHARYEAKKQMKTE